MKKSPTNWFKFSLSLVIFLLVRLIPFRPPNIEPILAAQMPLAGVYGARAGFLFGVLSILFYDIFTQTLGPWSILTAGAYGLLGLGAAFYLRNKKSIRSYVGFAIMGTIFFDAVTMLTGPLFFNQPLLLALTGQISFTALHLLGNISFAVFLSPVIYSLLAPDKNPKITQAVSLINPKII